MSVFDNMAYGLKIRRCRRPRSRARGAAAKILELAPARPQAAPALRRPAPARGHGPRHRAPAAGVPVRRAVVEPRRQAARGRPAGDPEVAPRAGRDQLFVTHDQVEAMTLAQRPLVMNAAAWSRSARRKRCTAPPGHHLRRRLHRRAADELDARAAEAALRARGRGAAGRATATAGADAGLPTAELVRLGGAGRGRFWT